MSKSDNGAFQLRLSNGRSIDLQTGTSLKSTDLPGLQGKSPNGQVAMVNRHPTDPSIQGLQNTSQRSWRVRLASGQPLDVLPGKSVRLAQGTRVNFGSITGEIQFIAAPAGRASSNTVWWSTLGIAALLLIAAGAWYFYPKYLGRRSPTTGTASVTAPGASKTGPAADLDPDKYAVRAYAVWAANINKTLNEKNGIYGLQDLIDFDCLDGAVFDPKTNSLSLFGHWADPNRHLRIPYYDYLATALESKNPTFSLEWMPESHKEIRRVLESGGNAILHELTHPWDANRKLKAPAAWFLQQNGIPVQAGMDHMDALAVMLEKAGRPKTANVVRHVWTWLNGSGEEVTLDFYKALGVDGNYQQVTAKVNAGTMSREQALDEFYPKFFAALSSGVESKSNYSDLYTQARAKHQPQSDAFRYAQSKLSSDVSNLYETVSSELLKPELQIAVPASVVAKLTGGVVPRVYPVFLDLPQQSLLARTALEADLVLKDLKYATQLKGHVPRYRTELEFERATGYSSPSGYYRWWITPGKFELAESPNGNVVRIAKSPLQINVRRQTVDVSKAKVDRNHIDPLGSGTDVVDPQLNAYAKELTDEYDALASEIPVLYDLRESMKIVALAHWIQQRGFHIELSKTGRTEWRPPKELPGSIRTIVSGDGKSVTGNSYAEGGVGFDMDPLQIQKDPNIRDAVASKPVPTKPADLDQQEKDLLDQLNKATTNQDKAAIWDKLFHVRSARGDKHGATDAFDAGMKADPRAFQDSELAIQNPRGGVMTPFDQNQPINPNLKTLLEDEKAKPWAPEMPNIRLQLHHPYPPLPPPKVPITPEVQQRIDKEKKEPPDHTSKLEGIIYNNWKKRDDKYQAEQNPTKRDELKRENEKINKTEEKEIKDKVKEEYGLDIVQDDNSGAKPEPPNPNP